MKKPFKISGIIAFVAVIGFSMTACPDDDTDNRAPKPENFIKVTDIDPAYNGKIGALKLYPINSSDVTVYSTEEKISGNSGRFPLYNWKGENPWLGSGSYRITIFIFENRAEAAQAKTIYKGDITEIAINEKTTTIEWTRFTEKP
ncbi:MAG: hypothetical protein LBC52_03115 [Treponema sp.]|jgi:hypothetical protein|nr:hypothetical protein [Treponema sp.]